MQNSIEVSYYQLMNDLNHPFLPDSITKFANNYFQFFTSFNESIKTSDYSILINSWLKFQSVYEYQKINPIELRNILHENNMDYSIFKDYLSFIQNIQSEISSSSFTHFINNFSDYEKEENKLIPPFFLFTDWLENKNNYISNFFKSLSQQHINSLSKFNHFPEFKIFVDNLFIGSKNDFFKINTDHLSHLYENNLFFDNALKKNTISIPENFIDYLKHNLENFSEQTIYHIELNKIKTFFRDYQNKRLEFNLPIKNSSFKPQKI